MATPFAPSGQGRGCLGRWMRNRRVGRQRWRKFPRRFLILFLILFLFLVFFLVFFLVLFFHIFSPANSLLPECTCHIPKPPASRRHRRLLTQRGRRFTRSRRRVLFIRFLGILCPIRARNHGLLVRYNRFFLPNTFDDACADKSPEGTRSSEAQETVIGCA